MTLPKLLSFKTAAAATLATVGMLATFAMPASAATTKGTMYAAPSGNCNDGATGGTAEGFANLNNSGGTVNGEVSLKGAHPNESFTVNLVAADGACTTIASLGTLTTNSQGNGNLSVPSTSVAGQTGWFIEAFGSSEFLASPAAH